MDRRRFLTTGLAAGGITSLRPALASEPLSLTAREATLQLTSPEYPPTQVWAYDGQAPGPELRFRRGNRLTRRLINQLPAQTTLHWHGLRLPNAMDGVPGLTQAPVAPGSSFNYSFDLTDAGTYWYHPHVRSWEQVARGLSGPLIIEEDEPPEVDRDLTLLLDDWRLTEDAQIDESFGSMHDWSHAGRIGNFVTVNGKADHRLAVDQHARLRLRLINAANARIFTVGIKGLEGWVVALDGQPLAVPERFSRLELAPAQRADLILDVTGIPDSEAFLISHERDGDYSLTALQVAGPVRSARIGSPPPPLPSNDLPPLGNVSQGVTASLVMEGGAMGGLRSAILNGVETDIRDIAAQGRAWAFNGVVGRTEAPLFTARLGMTVQVEMQNQTRWPHAMHVHGHHFRQVFSNGQAGPLRDTLLMRPRETARIAFVADNPGDWLIHCHMLEHAAAGMSTWFQVA